MEKGRASRWNLISKAEFQQSVWKALCEIPYGQTKTYSEIAQAIDKPSAVRAVGGAIGKIQF